MELDYIKSLNDIASREGLICLDQHALNIFSGQNALQLLTVAEKTRARIKADWDWITMDLVNQASSDIVFSLKNVYFYHPDINNFINEAFKHEDGLVVFTYSQTLEDKRYLYFVGITLEKLYSFWDRIGDLINIACSLGFPEDSVYFANVIDRLYKLHSTSPNAQWLKDFKDSDYTKLNQKRKLVVHHRGLYSHFLKAHLQGMAHNEPLQYWKELQKEKDEYPEFLKNQLKQTIIGFEKMVLLFKELDG